MCSLDTKDLPITMLSGYNLFYGIICEMWSYSISFRDIGLHKLYLSQFFKNAVCGKTSWNPHEMTLES